MNRGPCQTLLCHDIIKSAPAYSLLAGTLAAVAFLAIIFLLEHTRRSAGEGAAVAGLENVAVSLISAFLNLIIATFLYAALSGEEFLTPRAETLGFLDAISISIAFLNLLYGVVWLFEVWELSVAASVTATIAGLIAPSVTFVFIGLRALDMRAVATGSHHSRTWLVWILAILLTALVASFTASVRTTSRAVTGRAARRMGIKVFALGAVVLGVVTLVGAAAVSQLRTSYSFPGWLAAVLLCAVFVVFAGYSHLVQAIEAFGMTADGKEPAHTTARG
jgi:hypothetical protein